MLSTHQVMCGREKTKSSQPKMSMKFLQVQKYVMSAEAKIPMTVCIAEIAELFWQGMKIQTVSVHIAAHRFRKMP
jgi:hypothetical protein